MINCGYSHMPVWKTLPRPSDDFFTTRTRYELKHNKQVFVEQFF